MNSEHIIKQYIEPTDRFGDEREKFLTLTLLPNQDGTPTLKLDTDGELELSLSELREHIANCGVMLERLQRIN